MIEKGILEKLEKKTEDVTTEKPEVKQANLIYDKTGEQQSVVDQSELRSAQDESFSKKKLSDSDFAMKENWMLADLTSLKQELESAIKIFNSALNCLAEIKQVK